MLILTRKIGAILRIGEDVVITVLGVKGNQVRIGVDASEGTAIWREEIYQKLRAETPAGTPVPTHANRSNRYASSGGPQELKTL